MIKNDRTFTANDILSSKCGHLNQHLVPLDKTRKPSKYGNVITEVDGIKFDSKREANRYKVLRAKVKFGIIKDLRLQVEFELNESGDFSYKYIADFTYKIVETDEFIVDDSKGKRTSEYVRKRKLMKEIHGIIILES